MKRNKALNKLDIALDKMMDLYDCDLNEFCNVRVMRICDKITELESMVRDNDFMNRNA